MFSDVFALMPKMFKSVWKVARESAWAHHDVWELGVVWD
jgi:hypothetical protein